MTSTIDTNRKFYLQSLVGTSVLPDFQGGTLRIDQAAATDNSNYTVETFANKFTTNRIDAFGHSIVFTGTFSGAGSLEIKDSVGDGTIIVTAGSQLGGAVRIDSGATLQWGNGAGGAFLVGSGSSITNNGLLVLNFGGGMANGPAPISGSGRLMIQSGTFSDSAVSTYTGSTSIGPSGHLLLGGSIANSSVVADNGTFDISGTAGTSIVNLTGSGLVGLGFQNLTITNASGLFSGVLADGGAGGSLTIAGGTQTLTGANTFTGTTTINSGATLQLAAGGTVAGSIADYGLVRFAYAGPVTVGNTFSGNGEVEVAAGTVVVTAYNTFSGTVTIDSGATLKWGNGNSGDAILAGGEGSLDDNGTLLMDNGGDGGAGVGSISGSGRVTVQSGSFEVSRISTYTGSTNIAGGRLFLSGDASLANSSVADNSIFDISRTIGSSIANLKGSGLVSLGSQNLTLINASGTFSGVLADGGLLTGTGGSLTIVGGTETLTGSNSFTGTTTINSGATLQLGAGGATGTLAGSIVDNGLLRFAYSGAVSIGTAFSGSGSVEVAAGTVVATGGSNVGGTVTIDSGATLQWGNGSAAAFLVGAGLGVADNGTLLVNFGSGTIGGNIPIFGSGGLTIQSGSLRDSGASTYTGSTIIDGAADLLLSGTGSIANSSVVADNGTFDISGTSAGTSITALTGSGLASLGSQTLTITGASGTFSGVLADGGFYGGTGGGLAIAGGTQTLTGTNTFAGTTTINTGATLQLGAGGAGGTLAGHIALAANATLEINHAAGTSDSVSLTLGGSDVVMGGEGAETFVAGATLAASDQINGGGGADRVKLDGDYSAGLTLGASTLTNVETLNFTPGHSYRIVTNDATVAAGQTMNINGANLGASDMVSFNGSAETDGHFVIRGGLDGDSLTGGVLSDTFAYTSAAQSTSTHYDTVNAFNFANDTCDIAGGPGTITAIDAKLSTGSLSTASFDSDLATALSGHLGAHHAELFTASAGSLSGQTFLVVDLNGTAGYQAGNDLVIHLTGATGTLATSDFI